MLTILLIVALAGGGIYAAAHGLLGAVAKADVAKVKAEIEKLEVSASAEVKKVLADLKAKL